MVWTASIVFFIMAHENREPVKKKRDYAQALAVYGLILQYLPEIRFKPEELRMFPTTLVSEAIEAFDDAGLPPGYE